MLPKTNKDFEASSQTEKVHYLLSHPIPHVYAVGEVSTLKNLRDNPPLDDTPDFVFAHQFINDCFQKLQKVSYTKWQKLLDLPEINIE